MLSLPQHLDGLRKAVAADKVRYKDKGDKVAGAHVVIMSLRRLKRTCENVEHEHVCELHSRDAISNNDVRGGLGEARCAGSQLSGMRKWAKDVPTSTN